jgi:simple sugar transport system ATP-binding protein
MVELRGIGKYFPSNGVTALENAGFTLQPGEIHALLGENGSGKSTAMHILAGYFPPTSGAVFVDGKERRFHAPAEALAAGIGMVRQHPGFIRGFKVWEDCILGAEKHKREGHSLFFVPSMFFDPALSKKSVEEKAGLWQINLPLDAKAESLTVSQRQKAAVLALLIREVKWFIFDEPTTVLTPEETESLFELLKHLRNEGRGIIFITHKLDEALAVSDRVTVIRRGITGEPRNAKGLSIDDLKENIFGDSHFEEHHTEAQGHGEKKIATEGRCPPMADSLEYHGGEKRKQEETPVLSIKDLTYTPPGLPRVKNVNLNLASGKITGITGVRDGGLETLELAVTGLTRSQGKDHGKIAGSITLNGCDITGKGVRAFREAGGVYLGADRLGNNLAFGLPLSESLIIHVCRRARRFIFLDMKRLNSWCRRIMDRAGVARPASGRTFSFSGGMLQRILLAREFAENASLIVLAEPGSGLDQANRLKFEEELRSIVSHGAAALVFSTDIEELTSIAGEIMALRNGELRAAANRKEG